MIKCYSSEDTFVETDVIPIALDDLEAKGITVITGTAGSGKSRNSLEILRRFTAGHEMYCGIQLDNISEWNDVINHDDSLIVVLDDVFGKSNCIFNAEDENIFDKIYSTIVQGCVKVIFTLRNTIKSNTQVSDIINRQRVFQKSRFIDLDSADIEMDEEQRRECLLKYCKSNKIRIGSTEYLLKDKHSLDQSVPISLSLMETYEIAKIDVNPLMGYPQSCFLFTSNKEFIQQGVGFFKHPTKSLCDEIESLRKAGNSNEEEALQYTVLVYMALNEDLLDLHDIKLQSFNKVHELIYRKKEFTTQNIRRRLGQLPMRYLRMNPNGTYSFQHRSIFEGVLLSYKDIEAEHLIPLLHIDFILEIGRLDGNMTQPGIENEIILLFKKEDYNLLAQHIIAELRKGNSVDNFMERLCSSRILRNADRYFLDEILKEYMLSKCEMFCRLRNLDSEIRYRRFNEKILGIYFRTSKRTSVTFLTCFLKYSIKYADNNDTICHILELIEQDLNIYKTSYISTTHEQCFTEAILQSCVYCDSIKLNMILKFVKKNKIKLDEQLFVLYDFGLKCGFNIDRKIEAIKLLLHTFLTYNLIDSRHILEKVIDVNDTSLVELFFEQHRQPYPKIEIPLVLYHACAKGASSIVQWVFSNFPHNEFNIEKALIASCSCGGVESPVVFSSFRDEHLKDSGKVVLFLLKNFRTKINNLAIGTAMNYALLRSEFSTCRILMNNTDNYFDANEVLLEIARHTKYAYQSTACFDFVKYLVTDYSCSTVDIVLQIAQKFDENVDMVDWVMRNTQKEIFYTAWKKHKWIHKKICAVKLIYDTEFYKTLTVTNLIGEELQYGNNDCLRFLIEKIDIEDAVNVIFEKVCSCGDENLMQMIFEKYGSLNIVDAMNIALKNRNWEAVQWLCKNYDIEKLNFRAIMEEAITYGPISVIRYLTEIIDRKYFNSRDILLALEREELFMDEDDCELLIEWYLQDSQNRYRINDMLKLSCMKKQIYTQVLFNVLFQKRKNEFLHLYTALETLLVSQDFDSLKILLCTYDTNIFDMNMLMNCILGIFRNRTNADSIPVWLLQTFDPKLFDIPYILEKTCSNDNVEFVKWMDRQYEFSNLTLESVFINACKYSAISVLKWVFGKITFPISLKEVIKNVSNLKMSVVIFLIQNFELDRSDIDQICRIYSSEEVDQLEFQLCIFEAYGSALVDVKSVFDSVCRLSSIEEVKWFKSKVDNDLLNFVSAINEAVCGNKNEIFLFLFEFVNINDLQEANKIFIKACYHGNLEIVKILHNKYTESLRISVAMKELCKNESLTHTHFDVFKFLVSFSSPSIIDCQLLLNRACTSGDIESITWLLYDFDPDIFEVRSAIHHAFDKILSTDRKQRFEDILLLLLNRCQCTLSDIQAVMETVCSKGMVTLMKCLVQTFGVDSFDFRRILSIAISPINTEIYILAFCQCRNSQNDLQNIIVSACKTGGNEALIINIFFTIMVELDQHLVVDTIYAILDIRSILSTDITNEVIKFLFTKVDSNTVDFTSILKKIYMSGRNALVLWIMKNIHHSLIDIQETLHDICRKGDIVSMKYLLHTCKYGNLVNESCIHNAFSSGSFEMINMLITYFPHITIDTKVAMNNASSSGAFAVVQWLFYKYSLCPNRLSFLEPLLDLKLARSVFDLNSSMLNACRNGNTDVVQWLLQLYSYKTFDMRLSLIEASASGHTDLVKWMLAVYDNGIFDIETSLKSACKNGKLKVVQLFINKFGIDAFHMETITTEACKSGNKTLVEWLHEHVSCKLFEI